MKTFIRHLRRAALLHKGDGRADSQLLEAFLSRREEMAFELLLHRHGPMVLGVCRRILRNVHDAEDAFQATFLVLARKAGSLRSRELLGNWLYGVAYRTAMKAQAMNAKRRANESRAAEESRPVDEANEELLAQLDRELSRLPDKYRVPVVLCELEGRSRKEVSRTMGIPEGTLSSRLAQAKKLLARRLSRYGTVAVTAMLLGGTASACLSHGLRVSTVKAALSAGAVPADVLAVAEGVIKAMLLSKLKITICAATLMLLAGVAVSGLTYRATAQQPRQPGNDPLPARVARGGPQADDLEALRLEVEALRKSLQATRERVKGVEAEVQALKGRGGARPGMMGEVFEAPPGRGVPVGGVPGMAPGMDIRGEKAPATTSNAFPTRPEFSGGLLDEAEAALRRLRENPKDKQATEALERALKRLKQGDKPKDAASPGQQ